jgi:hypothetical protein
MNTALVADLAGAAVVHRHAVASSGSVVCSRPSWSTLGRRPVAASSQLEALLVHAAVRPHAAQ